MARGSSSSGCLINFKDTTGLLLLPQVQKSAGLHFYQFCARPAQLCGSCKSNTAHAHLVFGYGLEGVVLGYSVAQHCSSLLELA